MNPNKTVEKFAKKRLFNPEREEKKLAHREKNRSDFIKWLISQAKNGVMFSTIEEAEIIFNKDSSCQ